MRVLEEAAELLPVAAILFYELVKGAELTVDGGRWSRAIAGEDAGAPVVRAAPLDDGL